MATLHNTYNSIRSLAAAQCASSLVLPIMDAAIILVVSVLVCLRVWLLGA